MTAMIEDLRVRENTVDEVPESSQPATGVFTPDRRVMEFARRQRVESPSWLEG